MSLAAPHSRPLQLRTFCSAFATGPGAARGSGAAPIPAGDRQSPARPGVTRPWCLPLGPGLAAARTPPGEKKGEVRTDESSPRRHLLPTLPSPGPPRALGKGPSPTGHQLHPGALLPSSSSLSVSRIDTSAPRAPPPRFAPRSHPTAEPPSARAPHPDAADAGAVPAAAMETRDAVALATAAIWVPAPSAPAVLGAGE